MKFFKLTIENSDYRNIWIEEHNIPFKSKVYNKLTKKFIYKDCFFYKENINLLDELPENLEIISGEDEVFNEDVYMIFSDGGSFNNGKKDPTKPIFGSYATVVTKNGKEIYRVSKAEEDVTNNRCELKGGLKGLLYLNDFPDKKFVILVSDSQYYIKSLNEWMDGYIKRGWKNNEGKPVANKDLLEIFNKYRRSKPEFEILTCWVRGHEDKDTLFSKMNVECDLMCNESINEILLENGLPPRKIKK